MYTPICVLQKPLDRPVPLIITTADKEAVLVHALALPPAESSVTSTPSSCSEAVPPVAAVDAMEPAADCQATSLWAQSLATLFTTANATLLPPKLPSQSLALPLRIAVVGPPGCGCSTLAQALADTFSLKVLPNRRYCITHLSRR